MKELVGKVICQVFITGLVLALIFTPPAPPTFSEEDDELDNEEDRYWEIDENKDKDKYLN